jgi:hypothetical protein
LPALQRTSFGALLAPAAVYDINGRRYNATSPGFADAISDAHAAHRRPRCLCQPEDIEMYVARLGEGFAVKRRPYTGSHHAPDCPSYEPSAESSGLGQVLGSATTEDPTTGETTLKLDFSMSKIAGRTAMPTTGWGQRQRSQQRHEAFVARAAALPVGPGRANALAARVCGQTHLEHGAQASAAGGGEQDRAR